MVLQVISWWETVPTTLCGLHRQHVLSVAQNLLIQPRLFVYSDFSGEQPYRSFHGATGHFMVGDCAHHFMWSTPAACPISGTEPVNTTKTICIL